MPLDDLIKQTAEEAYDDLLEPGSDIHDKDVTKRKLEYWFQKLIIRAGSVGG